jgi:tetratricopeptide (TPR) repeat protein
LIYVNTAHILDDIRDYGFHKSDLKAAFGYSSSFLGSGRRVATCFLIVNESEKVTMLAGRSTVLNLRNSETSAMMFFIFAVSTLFSFAGKVSAAVACEPKVAKIVSIQGIVELRRAGQAIWQQASMDMTLCPGDMLRVRTRSRAALRLSNESMLRLDQKTTITFPQAQDDEATSLLDLFTGALHILTRTPKPFKIRTPFVNAGVEGTEFFVSVDQDSTQLVIYEGQVSVSNDKGSLVLVDHEAAIARKNEAPEKIGMISPTDAVQWALYYPTIIDYQLDEKITSEPAFSELRASVEFYQQGKLIKAISELDHVPQSARTAHFLNYYAGLLLSAGRVDEAKAAIEQALELEPDNSDAYALKAIIAVVQNDKDQALSLASQAVELNPISPTAKLALSYAQQAHFEIEEALASVQEAVKIDTQNALAWARLAELQMSTGQLDHALESARQAVNLNPVLAKTQTVLGFAYLLQIDTKAAKAIFTQAITLDQTDPMPRLGLGLALIREGELEAGRIELEIAASLDPANSLIRSYLGKAYFEEKRYPLASTQFDMAKERDPYDPTPWFYDAIQKQTQNRPVEALKDIQKSIELNDNRAVYRSKLLLDQDEAGRSSSLARIYDNLGFEKRALMETAKSLSFDPSNSSAHRFLSDTYANIPRHDIARVSELLQAQLLQPINVNPVQPHLAVTDLNIITNTGPAAVGFNEFAPLMERNRAQLVASGIVGSNSTVGDEVVASVLYDRASVSIGQFHHETNGFRPNNDQKQNIYNAFMQYAVTPKLNVQAELRTRKKEHGDLSMNFGPDTFDQSFRRKLEEDVARVGAKYTFTPNQDLLLSAAYLNRNENLRFPGEETVKTKDEGYQVETQYLLKEKFFNLIGGASFYRINVDNFGYFGDNQENSKQPSFTRESNKGYVYKYFNGIPNFNWTLGLSYASLEEFRGFDVSKVNPKFGLQVDITDFLRLRAAWFETVKTALVANQTLEPTQVAGFNQFFDDINGSQSQREGIGLDFDFSRFVNYSKNVIYGGVEYSERELKSPNFWPGDTFSFLEPQPEPFSLRLIEEQKEKLFRTYLYWLPHKSLAFRGEFQYEKFFRKKGNLGSNQPSQIETTSAPLSLSYFSPSGLSASLIATIVRQDIERAPVEEGDPVAPLKAGTSNFFLLDAVLSYRFPARRGLFSIEGRNLLNEHFSYHNSFFHISEPTGPRFVPERTFFARVTLNF